MQSIRTTLPAHGGPVGRNDLHAAARARRARGARGFSIVELLVVVGVIAVLAALLLPALGGVQRRGRKMTETANLRQIGTAWTLYANAHDDAALPGFLPPNVQGGSNPNAWRVTYRYENRDPIPPAIAAPWTWRLAPYFGYESRLVAGYLPHDGIEDRLFSWNDTIIDAAYGDGEGIYDTDTARPVTIAEQPAFGYNGYYLGGWYRMTTVPGQPLQIPRPRYSNVFTVPVPNDPDPVPGPIGVVARTISQVRGTHLIVFCSSTQVPHASSGSRYYVRFPDDRPGAHLVTPRFLGTSEIWRQSEATEATGPTAVQALAAPPDLTNCVVPIGRHTGQAATIRVDGSIELALPGALDDQRNWVNGATRPGVATHTNG